MKQKIFAHVALVLMLGFVSITFMGCDALIGVSNDHINDHSSTSETGLYYTFYNRSSYTVSLRDATGEVTLDPDESHRTRFNRDATIYDVDYSPADKVRVTQSGTSFTFRDR